MTLLVIYVIFSLKFQNMLIMKTLRLFSLILLATMVATSAFTQNAERTLVKSFNLKGKQVVVMGVDGNVEVKEWNGDIMRIQMSIELTNGSNSMLKSLIQARRYTLVAAVDGEELKINMPSMEKKVKIRGRELTEKISYTVFAPSDVQVKLANESSASALDDLKSSSLK